MTKLAKKLKFVHRKVENIEGKGEHAAFQNVLLLIRSLKTGRIICPVHISKTILAMIMKFCGWIDLIKESAVPMNLNSC